MAIVDSHSVVAARKSGKIPPQLKDIDNMANKLIWFTGKIYEQSIKASFDKSKYGNEFRLFALDNFHYYKSILTYKPVRGSVIARKLGPWATLFDAMLNNMQQTSFDDWKDVIDSYMTYIEEFSYVRIDNGDEFLSISATRWDAWKVD